MVLNLLCPLYFSLLFSRLFAERFLILSRLESLEKRVKGLENEKQALSGPPWWLSGEESA